MKILVIDDETELTVFLKEFLEDKGHEVQTAENGKDGLEHLKTDTFDIVFTDHNMPELSGIELAKYAKQKQLKAKIVIMTGYPVMKEFFAKALGAHEYLTKPFNFEVIEEIVKKYAKNE